MLKFDPTWRFSSPGPVPSSLVYAFYNLVEKIAQQGDGWGIVETFKRLFGAQSTSSSESRAWSDLMKSMKSAAENAPLFIEAFYKGCVTFSEGPQALAVPNISIINRVLAENDAGFEIRPAPVEGGFEVSVPLLVATRVYTPVAVPQETPSFDSQARAIINDSLATSEKLLTEQQGRRAVQEVLWLLESIVTAFRGTGPEDAVTIQGKYFNSIVKEMKAKGRGTAQEQILNWMTTLHGFLSSPTGGGVRHGADIQSGVAIQTHEARLYCNMIRSYITYMIDEHEQRSVDRH
jgi:hypothetical protein